MRKRWQALPREVFRSTGPDGEGDCPPRTGVRPAEEEVVESGEAVTELLQEELSNPPGVEQRLSPPGLTMLEGNVAACSSALAER